MKLKWLFQQWTGAFRKNYIDLTETSVSVTMWKTVEKVRQSRVPQSRLLWEQKYDRNSGLGTDSSTVLTWPCLSHCRKQKARLPLSLVGMTSRLVVNERPQSVPGVLCRKSTLCSFHHIENTTPLMQEFPILFQSTGGTGDTSIGLSIKSHGVLSLGDIIDLNEI